MRPCHANRFLRRRFRIIFMQMLKNVGGDDEIEPIDRLLNTTAKEKRDHLYFGVHVESREQILVPRAALRAHTHVLGPSDVGKSQLGLNPMLIQLIRLAGRDLRRPNPVQQSSIVFLDMKGDEVLLQTAAIEARNAGLPFRVVTNILGLPTFGFNPMHQVAAGEATRAGEEAEADTEKESRMNSRSCLTNELMAFL